MERADILIRQARDQTGNQRYSATQGIPQREMVRHLNAGQMRIYNKLLQERSTLFTKVSYLSTVAGQAEYTLPDDIFLKHNLIKVDYSFDGNAINYSPLEMRSPRQEISVQGYPSSYFTRHGTIILSPIPSNSATNALRLNYQYRIPTLDIRRGTATPAAMSTSIGTLNDIGFGTSSIEKLCFGNGTFIAAGSAGKCAFTSDSEYLTWGALVTSGFGANRINSAAYGGGVWVLVGNSSVATEVTSSTDFGTTFTARTTTGVGVGTFFQDVCYGGGQFIAVGSSGRIARSTDGITWTAVTTPFDTGNPLENVRYMPEYNKFVASGVNQVGISNADGTSWALVTLPMAGVDTFRIAYGNGIIAAMDLSILGQFSVSLDGGTTWEARTGHNTATRYYTHIDFANGKFFIPGAGSKPTLVSSDTQNWVEQGASSSNGANSVAGNSDILMLAGNTGLLFYHTAEEQLSLLSIQLSDDVLAESAETLEDGIEYVCLVDKYGTQLVAGLPVLGYEPASRTIFIEQTELDEVLSDVAYVVFGANASTHSALDDVCERYLADYLALRIQMRDSNSESADTSPILLAIEQDILDAVGNLEEDLPAIPILDRSMLNYSDDL